jgi:hypothetical protein
MKTGESLRKEIVLVNRKNDKRDTLYYKDFNGAMRDPVDTGAASRQHLGVVAIKTVRTLEFIRCPQTEMTERGPRGDLLWQIQGAINAVATGVPQQRRRRLPPLRLRI